MGNITRLSKRDKADLYYSQEFLNELENHIPELLRGGFYERHVIEPGIGAAFAGDFYTVARRSSVPERFLYITMRCNGFISPSEFTGRETEIIIPQQQYIHNIYRLWRTYNRKT